MSLHHALSCVYPDVMVNFISYPRVSWASRRAATQVNQSWTGIRTVTSENSEKGKEKQPSKNS